jgi:hypothetical protein
LGIFNSDPVVAGAVGSCQSRNKTIRYLENFNFPDGLLDKLAMLIWEHPSLIVLGVIIFGDTIYVRKRMESIFSKFWSALRANLSNLLK